MWEVVESPGVLAKTAQIERGDIIGRDPRFLKFATPRLSGLMGGGAHMINVYLSHIGIPVTGWTQSDRAKTNMSACDP